MPVIAATMSRRSPIERSRPLAVTALRKQRLAQLGGKVAGRTANRACKVGPDQTASGAGRAFDAVGGLNAPAERVKDRAVGEYRA